MAIPSPAQRSVVAFALALALLATLFHGVKAHHEWRWVASSSYGEPSEWDGGHFDDAGNPTGYFGHELSWYWHCAEKGASGALPDHDWAFLRYSSRGVAHQSRPLGSYVEMILPTPAGRMVTLVLPITDRGPYGPWGEPSQPGGGGFDIQETVIWGLGWESSSEWGVRAHLARPRPDLGRFCPRQEVRLPDHVGLWLEDRDYDQAADGLASLEDALAVLGWPTPEVAPRADEALG
jgi:hypothetical protein